MSPPDRTLHIYTRVSTVVQAEKGTSLDSQLELGTKKARELGFSVQHWDEGGRSSHHEDIADRPVLARLFAQLKEGGVKHLWVYDQSRLSRNDQVASIIRYECNKQGVTLYTKDGQYDLGNPQDKFMKQLLDAVAELDNATRTERTRLGKLRRVQAGQWHGGPPPFGYRNEQSRLVIEPNEAVWVRKMFEASLNGDSPAKIKLMLDSAGVTARRGGLWTLGSIAAMLKNSHYQGRYSFTDSKSGESFTVPCPSAYSGERDR
jgi:DNA invertase Pin-like site-specific DNA recombinase